MATPLNAKPEYLEWLGPKRALILQRIDDWPMDFVAEKLIESGHSTQKNVNEHILWYKQFMSFKVLRPSVRCGMFSDIVDGVWHQHILFTHDYEKFGNEIFGSFIHHVPCNIMDMSPGALREYKTWLTDYEEAFGELPNDMAEELTGIGTRAPSCTKVDHPNHNPESWKCSTR